MAKIEEIIESIDKFLLNILSSKKLRSEYLLGNSFTRDRQLTLSTICHFLLSQYKGSLSVDLEDFFELSGSETACTKSAFSQARYHIKPALFRDMLVDMTQNIYKTLDAELLRWHGFYVKAVDGTTLDIPDTCDVWEVLGGIKNQYGRKTLARVVLMVDAQNGFITQAKIGGYGCDELALSDDFIAQSNPDDLLVYDRKFGNFSVFYKHIQGKVPFLIRIKKDLNKQVSAFMEGSSQDAIITIPISKSGLKRLKEAGFEVDKSTTVSVRLLKIVLSTGEIEVLATNLTDTNIFKYEEFKELYALRWVAETTFELAKNKFQIELFSGHKAAAIEQDFYATCISINLNACIWQKAAQELVKINAERTENGLVKQQLNKNVAIGLMKRKITKLLTKPAQRTDIIKQLIKKIMKYKIATKPNRNNPRKFKTHRRRGKYRTMSNYRKVI